MDQTRDNLALGDVPWGTPAMALLAHAKHLVPRTAAIVMLRHSEREQLREVKDLGAMPLNERGKRTALEFGKQLPRDRSYHFFSSPLTRCRQTAEHIRDGVKQQGAIVSDLTDLPSLVSGYVSKQEYVKALHRDGSTFIANWVAGHYPPSFLEPTQSIAQRTAAEMLERLQSAEPNATLICVSHDQQVTFYLFHWAGILNTESYIKFLDGFILQSVANQLIVYHKNGIKEFIPPHWWKSEERQ